MSDIAESEDPDWSTARAVWRQAGVEIPPQRSTESEHFLSDLKRAAAMFREMSRVTSGDRTRNWKMQDGAKLCRELSEFLSSIDDVALQRIARAGVPGFDPTLITFLDHLAKLEHTFRRAPEDRTVRRRKHELNDPLVIRLADSFERNSGRKASVTTDPVTSERGGVFVEFVLAFIEHFLPDQQWEFNARSIQRALSQRRALPPDPLTD